MRVCNGLWIVYFLYGTFYRGTEPCSAEAYTFKVKIIFDICSRCYILLDFFVYLLLRIIEPLHKNFLTLTLPPVVLAHPNLLGFINKNKKQYIMLLYQHNYLVFMILQNLQLTRNLRFYLAIIQIKQKFLTFIYSSTHDSFYLPKSKMSFQQIDFKKQQLVTNLTSLITPFL